MEGTTQTLIGTVKTLGLFPKTHFPQQRAGGVAYPLGIKAELVLEDGKSAYIDTSSGEVVDLSGAMAYMPPKNEPWLWAIPQHTGEFSPAVWPGSVVEVEMYVKEEKTSKIGKPYLVCNRAHIRRVLALKDEAVAETPAPVAPVTPVVQNPAPPTRRTPRTPQITPDGTRYILAPFATAQHRQPAAPKPANGINWGLMATIKEVEK